MLDRLHRFHFRVVQLTTVAENGTATLRTPVYLQHKMRKLRHKLLEKDRAALQRRGQLGNVRRPVVSCRRPERNWHWGQTTVGQPLASAGWARSSRSHGDHFTVRRLADAPPPLETEPFPDWLDPRLLAALRAMSITRPSPVQVSVASHTSTFHGYCLVPEKASVLARRLRLVAPLLWIGSASARSFQSAERAGAGTDTCRKLSQEPATALMPHMRIIFVYGSLDPY